MSTSTTTIPTTSPFFSPSPTTQTRRRISTIRCGPRDNRGPLLKGRILSTEAIQTIQSLKRAQRTTPTQLPTHLLTRLLKSDLTSSLTELLRQNNYPLALTVFSALKSEYGADLNAYAEIVVALSRNGMKKEIDELVLEMEVECGGRSGSDDKESKGLVRLVKAVIEAERRDGVVRVWRMVKGWREGGFMVDEYLGRVLSKGLRRVGEGGMADEVDLELGRSRVGAMGRPGRAVAHPEL